MHDVTVSVKEFMRKPMYMGMSADVIFAGPPPALFAGGIPVMELDLAFELKAADDSITQNVAARYEAMHQRVDAIYPLG